MKTFEIIGIIASIFILIKLKRGLFGYSQKHCPNDHDTMARQGAFKCSKCKSNL